MDDTIVAISTALGVGAISIIRLSGKDSLKIVNSIFDKNILNSKTHTIHYGHIIYNNEIIDEVLVNIMLSPKTFTTEDVIEINCHGGIYVTNKVLEILLLSGARLAEPGEFTKRAFINGRIDLIEAESVMDLINSKTDVSRKMSINSLNGNVSQTIKNIRKEMSNIITNIEVNIDYPEYEDILVVTNDMIKTSINKLKTNLLKVLKDSENGLLIKNGINTLIVGRPNVGKSSLLNKLLNEEKAIVTDIEGTTRDIVEGSVNINGIVLNIIDTAGIHDTDNIVEKIGVEKSLNLINKADLVIVVLSNNESLTKDDIDILEKTKNCNRIIYVNKSDLPSNIGSLAYNNIVYGTTINETGIDNLKNKIINLYNIDKISSSDLNYLTSTRGIVIVKECLSIINDIEKSLIDNLPVDMIEIDIKRIWDLLGGLIGESYDDELIDNLFSKFCLGK